MIGDLGVLSWLQTNIKKLMQKTTTPSYDPDTDSNEAISEAVAAITARVPSSGTIQTAYFRKGVEATFVFPIFDKTGSLVSGAADLDSEVSKDGGNFADCTNEASEIQSSGIYKLVLTATEMNADIVCVITKTSTTDAKTTPTVIYTSA